MIVARLGSQQAKGVLGQTKTNSSVSGRTKMNYSVMQEGSNRSDEPRSKSPLAFFLMAFALYVPFVMWANVRTFAVGAFLPVIAALILVYRENRTAGMVELLRRSFDYKRIKSRI